MRLLKRVFLGLTIIFVIGAIGNYLDPRPRNKPEPRAAYSDDAVPVVPEAVSATPAPVAAPAPAEPVPPIPRQDMKKGKARLAERRAIREAIGKLHTLGASVMKNLREAGDLKLMARCQALREENDVSADALAGRAQLLDPEDFELKVAVGEVKLCASCMTTADYYCGTVAQYLKR